jgi:hypothetical protein
MSHTANATAVAAQPSTARIPKPYRINVADLIVHKYDEADVMLRKASTIAHDIIVAELRNGEFMRSPQLGIFELFFPALRKAAGELRASVIAEQIAREIRNVNPGSIALEENANSFIERREKSAAAFKRAPGATPSKPKENATVSYIDRRGVPTDEEMRRQATQAFGLMATSNCLRLEELLGRNGIKEAAEAEMAFSPVWNVRRNVVSGYECRLLNSQSDIGISDGSDPMTAITDAREDAVALLRVTSLLQSAVVDGSAAVMIVPVHFSTLDNTALRTAHFEALTAMNTELRQFLVFEVRNIPASASRFRLTEIISQLRGRCRNVVARLPADTIDFARFKNAGFYSATLQQPVGGDQRAMRLFDRFANNAQKAGLQMQVCDLSRRSLVLAAIASGFSYISGPAVCRSLASPAGIVSMELDRLYSRTPRRREAANEVRNVQDRSAPLLT